MAITAAPASPEALPFAALLAHLPPATRAAYHHERRRGRTEFEALAVGVVLPDAAETLLRGERP